MRFGGMLQDNLFNGVLTLDFVHYHEGNTKRHVLFYHSTTLVMGNCHGSLSSEGFG